MRLYGNISLWELEGALSSLLSPACVLNKATSVGEGDFLMVNHRIQQMGPNRHRRGRKSTAPPGGHDVGGQSSTQLPVSSLCPEGSRKEELAPRCRPLVLNSKSEFTHHLWRSGDHQSIKGKSFLMETRGVGKYVLV